MKRDELQRNFREWLLAAGKSRSTARVYLSRVRGFLQFLPGDCIVNAAKLPADEAFTQSRKLSGALCSYLEHRNDSGIKEQSIKAIATAVETFIEFLNLTPSSDGRWLSRLPAVPAADCIQNSSTAKSAKVRLILALMTHEGLYVGDCAGIDLSDICFTNDQTYLHVRRRGRSFLAPLCQLTETALFDWLDERALMKPRSEALLLNYSGERISCSGIDYLVRSTAQKSPVAISPKILRSIASQPLSPSPLRPISPPPT